MQEPKNNKLVFGLIVAVLILFAWMVATSLSADAPASAEPETTTPATTYTESPELIATARQSFVDGCIGEAASKSYCECAFRELHQEMGTEGIMQLGLEYSADPSNIPEPMMRAAMACLEEY